MLNTSGFPCAMQLLCLVGEAFDDYSNYTVDRCVPFQIMFNQLGSPQVDSNEVVETSLL
jgi:hypothetical protein